MNGSGEKYTRFGICSDMIKAARVIRNYTPEVTETFIRLLHNKKKLFITGEGSSRIFPGKNVIYNSLKHTSGLEVISDGASQAKEYNLKDFAIIGLTNSGKTRELVTLFNRLMIDNHPDRYAVTASNDSFIKKLARQTHVLKCGKEKAVAATVSVIEQALFLDHLIVQLQQIKTPSLTELADKFSETLSINIPDSISDKLSGADIIYFAGRNNGVAEELTLKTNEIIRKKSDYLEGTYAIHGIEEVMTHNDVMILIEPDMEDESQFKKYLSDGVGLDIFTISSRDTIFPNIKIPKIDYFEGYLQLAAGWNLLVECGLKLGIDIDKPQRARKIGNEYTIGVL